MSSTDQPGRSMTAGQDRSGSGDILIEHTNTEGTLVHGTARGDGSRDPLKAARFKWSRNLGAWFLPQSRGHGPRTERIDTLADALRAAGFTVTVEIEEYDAATTFQARQEASERRSDALDEKAAREGRRADQRYDAAHAAVAAIPFGQPILVGHHSERRHRRDLARHDANMCKGVDHSKGAARAAERSNAARSQAARRENPVVMGRRISRLEAEQREIQRRLASATGEYAGRLALRLEVVEQDLAFLRESIQQSGARQFTKADVRKGDHVKIRGSWRIVERANAKTVSVQTAYSWSDRYPYHEVTDHRRTGGAVQRADAGSAPEQSGG